MPYRRSRRLSESPASPSRGETVMHKEQVAAFFGVTLCTVENYLNQYGEELVKSMMGSLYYLAKVSLQKAEINDIRWLQDY
jgi:hypothetical protein